MCRGTGYIVKDELYGDFNMSKSRTFSIYLLKEGYTSENSLKNEHNMGEAVKASNLPDNAVLYIQDNTPVPPWWKNYWGISKDLNQSLKGAIVFIGIDCKNYALTFGHTYHNLKDESYEYDFGLKTTLNALDPEKIKSTDILQPENAKRERIQSPTSSDLTFFDFNKDESIIKKLTGSVKEEYKDLLSNITGASNLRVSSKVSANEIVNLCREIYEIYKKDDFKTTFPDLQNISPVKDPEQIGELDKKIVEAFHNNSIELVLAIPEIMDHSNSFQIKYSGCGRTNDVYNDVYISHYRDYLESHGIKSIDISILKKHNLNIENENGYKRCSYTIYKSLLFDCENKGEYFHLCEGHWYKINTDYMQKIIGFLDSYFVEHDVLKECHKKREDEYNIDVSENNPQYICLDKTNISPKGQYQVEPCDLYTVFNDTATLIHIKISTRSSSLSHLFNQGINSVELLRSESESKEKLKKLLKNDKEFIKPLISGKYNVIYGIISAKDMGKKSLNLPIFSRISLARVLKGLIVMGIDSSVVLIKDKVDRKKKKEISEE